MESINANQSSAMIQKSLLESLNNVQKQSKSFGNPKNVSDKGAYLVSPDMMGGIGRFDSFFDKFAVFKDKISTCQNSFDKMREQGESILALINKARTGEESDEALDEISNEVNKLISSIDSLYENTTFDGVNLFSEPFGMTIPNWKEIFGTPAEGVSESESPENQISEMLASVSVDFDMSGVFGDNMAFGMSGSAEIKIGYTDDGALQISVDASMNFDLSGISQYGVQSDEAFDIINNFLSLLGVKTGQMGNANNFLDALFEQSFNAIGGFAPSFSVENGEGGTTSAQIAQHATITLDGANQMPNIAINIL